MSSQVHPEEQADSAAIDAMREALKTMPPADLSPSGRAAFSAFMEQTEATSGVGFEQASIGGIQGWWCKPASFDPGPVMLYFHGGAHVVGSAFSHRNFVSKIVADSGVPAFIADYSLAPEHPFPAAFDEALKTYRGLVEQGHHQVVLAGDSAGGGLALAVLAESQKTHVHPVGVLVFSPWTDLTLSSSSMESRASQDPLLTRALLEEAAKSYVGHEVERSDPRVSPAFGISPHVPVMIHVGDDEVLLDDSRRFAAMVEGTGGVVELHVWRGMTHVFISNFANLLAARQAMGLAARFVRDRGLGDR